MYCTDRRIGSTYVCSKEISFPIEYDSKPAVLVSPEISVPANANAGYAFLTASEFKLKYQRNNTSFWFAIGKKTE